MTRLLLVHGAWHGGWVWDRVRDALRRRGIAADAVDLPGHDGDPEVALIDQVTALTAALDGASEPVFVVAHSHGGIVAQQAIAARPDRCVALIGVDAWFGRDGQSFLDIVPPTMSRALRGTIRGPAGRQVIPAPTPQALGVPADSAAELAGRLSDQPLRTFTDPIRLPADLPPYRGAAILCQPSALPFDRIAADHGLPTSTIASGHDVPVTHPIALADHLLRTCQNVVAL